MPKHILQCNHIDVILIFENIAIMLEELKLFASKTVIRNFLFIVKKKKNIDGEMTFSFSNYFSYN